jgi:15-cis-phytoene synthase/lycopene beta-cyclase
VSDILVEPRQESYVNQVAVIYTIPWDAYLIYARVWTYPPNATLGPTLFRIPIEELFFFVIQTYTTSLLYILVNKPTLFVVYLQNMSAFRKDAGARRSGQQGADLRRMRYRKLMGQVFFASMTTVPLFSSGASKNGTYLRLICAWAGP